ncbi:MAG: efflux RND transporter permease subunit [Gammaproteobacteria bacterium]|nr:efflux RND transporter permease subunit [Gammaproteobacteria bacterium]MDH5304688.1 efflux RND transporter permease subunit [Gammaproteobacteria bacterium]MDH5323117.1 efflux RND transporter permease subunit [Gammaproteobacteria bacterium]
MDIAAIAIKNRTVTLVLTAVMLVVGIASFQNMSRLEDPEFTIKDALVMTPYPGASAEEVEQEVSDLLEIAVQQLGQLDRVVSKSERGLSTLTVTIKDQYGKELLPQVWDELRRKVNDAAVNLPPGAGQPVVVDDYGDVFGVFVAVTADGYSYAELKDYVDILRRELLLVQDVGKISTYGERKEAVYITFDRDRLSQLGIDSQTIVNELLNKNVVTNSGRVKVGTEFVTIEPSGGLTAVDDFGQTLIRGSGGQQIFLRDIAEVRRDYVEPQMPVIRYDGKLSIGLGISTVSGGNVITMGEALKQRLQELDGQRPVGIDFGVVSVQSDAVATAISGFVVNLLEAVVIVIVVLLLFMGLRSGLLIGAVLFITILGSFIFLEPMGVALERISLGALIIALGMLVDNAIVVVDGMLIRMQKGEAPEDAASVVVKQSAWPLLGATIIAILAFAAIGTSNDNTGEFCRSLFQVVMVSLLLSWVTAVTITPVLCVMFLKAPAASEQNSDPYASGFYQKYMGFLRSCIRRRYLTTAVVVGMFSSALWGFSFVDQSFFPSSTRPQFMLDIWLPQGTHIDETTRYVVEIEDYLAEFEEVTHVTSLIGKGGLRFLLTYTPEKLNSAYAQFLIDVENYRDIAEISPRIDAHLAEQYPGMLAYTSAFQLGPGSTGKIQARFSGPDIAVLRRLANEASAIYAADPDSKSIRTDWRQQVKLIRPILSDQRANISGITRPMVAKTMSQAFQGEVAGYYREDELQIPIILRASDRDRGDIASAQNLQIWSPVAQQMIPLRQVVSSFDTVFENEIINRRNRSRTIIAYADPVEGLASQLFERVRPKVEAIELPEGYSLEWGGEYEDSGKAQAALKASIPAFVLAMILVTIILFNSLRQPLIIWLCVPLALIGVTVGLLSTGQPFGFMALLGFLSLMGMLIKNAIVLIDQINVEVAEGKQTLPAIIDSGASRLRPVAMAALTTALGMLPLLLDAFFASMAITIIGGLVFATVLTMIVVPVFYSIFYRA